MTKLATFGILCLLAIVVVSYARHDRLCAVKVAGILAANWLLFSMPWIYAPASFEFVMHALGLPGRQEDGWAMLDLASLVMVTVVGWRVWWSPIIWSIYLVQLTMHAVAWANGLEYVDYAAVLDGGLAVQLAVLFMIGGPGFAVHLSSLWHRLRGVGMARQLGEASS